MTSRRRSLFPFSRRSAPVIRSKAGAVRAISEPAGAEGRGRSPAAALRPLLAIKAHSLIGACRLCAVQHSMRGLVLFFGNILPRIPPHSQRRAKPAHRHARTAPVGAPRKRFCPGRCAAAADETPPAHALPTDLRPGAVNSRAAMPISAERSARNPLFPVRECSFGAKNRLSPLSPKGRTPRLFHVPNAARVPRRTFARRTSVDGKKQTLRRDLKNRHIQMIALGGAVGTACFTARPRPSAWPVLPCFWPICWAAR